MKYHFTCIKEKKGFWGTCLEIDGCSTEGATIEEYKKNCKEALELCLQEPTEVTPYDNIIEITPEPKYCINEKIQRY